MLITGLLLRLNFFKNKIPFRQLVVNHGKMPVQFTSSTQKTLMEMKYLLRNTSKSIYACHDYLCESVSASYMLLTHFLSSKSWQRRKRIV